MDAAALRVRDRSRDRRGYLSGAWGGPASTERARGPRAPLKKTRDPGNRDNSCGIANEPGRHPNDGWVGPGEAPIRPEKKGPLARSRWCPAAWRNERKPGDDGLGKCIVVSADFDLMR